MSKFAKSDHRLVEYEKRMEKLFAEKDAAISELVEGLEKMLKTHGSTTALCHEMRALIAKYKKDYRNDPEFQSMYEEDNR